MQKLKTLSLFLLFSPLFATNIEHLTKELSTILCSKEADIKCDKDTYLTYSKYITLDNDKLLIFLNLVSPNSSPYSHGNKNMALIFDQQGKWRKKAIVEGSIDGLIRDPKGGLWLSHPWVIEGTSPALSFSRDGQIWQRVSFPKNRPRATIESMDFCLLSNEITLTFDNFEGKYSYWKTSYYNAQKKHPHWKNISKKEYNQQRCLEAGSINNHWYDRSKNNQLDFYNSHSNITTTIPNHMAIQTNSPKPTYTIQVGHFKIKKSLDIVTKELKGIIGYSTISKQLPTGNHKLFLGSFRTQQEAKKALNRLRRRYQKNRYINEAFVTKLAK
jgi:hypothetical protein